VLSANSSRQVIALQAAFKTALSTGATLMQGALSHFWRLSFPARISLFFVCVFISGGCDKPQVSEAPMRKLISDLGDKDFRTREKASKELIKIGQPALDALYIAEQSDDQETRQRAAQAVKTIRAANGLPTRVNGLEFKLIVPKVWVVPEKGKATKLDVGLQVTNKTSSNRSVAAEMIVPKLYTKAGESILEYGGSSGVLAAQTADLGPNQSHIFRLRGGWLDWRNDKLGVAFRDPFNNSYVSDAIAAGEYSFSLVFTASPNIEPRAGTGTAETLRESVVIK